MRFRWHRLRPVEPERRYVVSAGLFVVDRARNVPRFLWNASRVRRMLPWVPGLAGYALLADFRTRSFTELSAFDSRQSMAAFVRMPKHQRAMQAMLPHLGPGSKFVSIEVYGRDLPPRPELIAQKLEEVPGFADAAGSSRSPVVRRGAADQAGAGPGPARP